MTIKTALFVLGGLTITVGLIIGIILVTQRQLINQKAAVPTGGSATFRLDPANTSIEAGQFSTISGILNTGSVFTSGYTINGVIDYSGEMPADIVDASGNPASSLTNLISETSNCLENSVTRTTGRISFIITCVVPASNNTGYSTNSQDVTAFNLRLKGLVSNQTVTITFNNDVSRVDNRANNTDTLMFPTGGTYAITGTTDITPTTTTTPSITTTPNPNATNTPTSSPTPTTQSSSGSSTTNSCGGTCGSNNNCNGDLFCNTNTNPGYCRNPQCPDSTNCNCGSNPTPTTAQSSTTSSGSSTLPQSGASLPTLIVGTLGIILVVGSISLLL
jgi:hypothetical protein